MRFAISGNNKIEHEIINDMLTQYFSEKPIGFNLSCFNSGTNLIYDVEDDGIYDVIFLDSYMEDMLLIDAAKRLRSIGFDGKIILMSSNCECAIDGYDIEASGYLLKPYTFERLETILDRILLNLHKSTLSVCHHSNLINIPINEILFAESNNTKCIIHRSIGVNYTVYKRLNEIEEELSDCRFLRCHQSYLVNMDYISRADREFELTTGDIVNIRQREIKKIRQKYFDYVDIKHCRQRFIPKSTALIR